MQTHPADINAVAGAALLGTNTDPAPSNVDLGEMDNADARLGNTCVPVDMYIGIRIPWIHAGAWEGKAKGSGAARHKSADLHAGRMFHPSLLVSATRKS